MAYCIQHKRANRCIGILSFHVLDIIQSIMIAAKTGKKQKFNQLVRFQSFVKWSKKNFKIIYANWNRCYTTKIEYIVLHDNGDESGRSRIDCPKNYDSVIKV